VSERYLINDSHNITATFENRELQEFSKSVDLRYISKKKTLSEDFYDSKGGHKVGNHHKLALD